MTDMRELSPAGRTGAVVITPVMAARRLQAELAALGVASDVHDGYGLALVSVRYELVVWTDGRVFRWRVGQEARHGAAGAYAFGPVQDPVTTAQRVAGRYVELRRRHPPRGPIAGDPQ
ncbi:hypothetical protein GCM10017673_36130 [Streptosporangium violaceochromogenes]|nr:hypothetical protein GCM10017673_36130 [Streptosporangium violaceochromogenes]